MCVPAAEVSLSFSSLLLGIVLSSIGLGFFIYGKRQKEFLPLLCGFALMIVPYFITNQLALIVVGLALTAIPFWLRDKDAV